MYILIKHKTPPLPPNFHHNTDNNLFLARLGISTASSLFQLHNPSAAGFRPNYHHYIHTQPLSPTSLSLSPRSSPFSLSSPPPFLFPMENQKEFMRKKSEEPPKRCPRCDSMHTKFCYFNNYSPSQPRHFCKSCRRYWTDGGTIRNIPQGGGCIRKAKRTRKSSSSPLLDQRNHLSAPAQEINGAGFHHSSRVPISSCFVEQSPDPARVLPPSSNVGAFAAGFAEPVDSDLFAWQQQQKKIPAPRQVNAAAANAGQPAANWGGAAAATAGVEEEDELDRWVRELANDGSA